MFYLKGLKKSHRISRLLQIMIAIALFIGLDQLWETSLLQGQQLLKSQTEKMARLLVQQTAYGAAPALQLENDEQLQWLAQALVLDPKVMSASIFSEDGVRLSFAQSVIDEELEPDSEELTTILEQYPPYVEAVSQDGNNLGYVEVRLEPKYFFNEIKEAHHINMEQQQIMLLIAGLIGMLLSRALSFKRADFDRRKARVKLRRLLAKKNEKAAAKAAKKQLSDAKKQARKTNASDISKTQASDEAQSIPLEEAVTTPALKSNPRVQPDSESKPEPVPESRSELKPDPKSKPTQELVSDAKQEPERLQSDDKGKVKAAPKPKAAPSKPKTTRSKTAAKAKVKTETRSVAATKKKAKAEFETKPAQGSTAPSSSDKEPNSD